MPFHPNNPSPSLDVGGSARASSTPQKPCSRSHRGPTYKRLHTSEGRAEARLRRAEGGLEAPEGGRLGSKRQYIHPPKGEEPLPSLVFKAPETKNDIKKRHANRRETAADGRQAGRIYNSFVDRLIEDDATPDEIHDVAGRGVTMCAWTQIADVETLVKRVGLKTGGSRSFMTGLQCCGLRSVCPSCTHKAARRDKAWVNDAMAQARKEGLIPVMMTLTVRHSRRDTPKLLLDAISTAEQRIKRLAVWKRVMENCGGYCRVLEWTWDEKNGHHPHYHEVLFVRADDEAKAIAVVEDLRGAYMRQLQRVGRDGTTKAAWKHSFQVQGASAVSNYITKWGVAEELTGAQSKDAGGLTSWQLLRKSRTDSDNSDRQKFAAVWWEIIQAMKGRTQLHKSTDFIALAERFRETQEVEEQIEPETLLSLGTRKKGDDPTLDFEIARVRKLAIFEAAESALTTVEAISAAKIAMRRGMTDTEILDAGDDDVDFCVIDDDDDMRDWVGFAQATAPPPQDGGEKESNSNYLSEAINNLEISLTG